MGSSLAIIAEAEINAVRDRFSHVSGTATRLGLVDRLAALAFALLYVEESGVPLGIPGDFFIGYVGHTLPRTPMTLLLAWLAFILLVVAGASNLYLVSRRWGHRLLQGRRAAILHLTPERMARAESWYRRWGILTVIFGRHVPGLRIPLTVAAGMSRMGYPAFAISVAVSTALWSGVLLMVGSGLAAWLPGIAVPSLHSGRPVAVALAVVVAVMVAVIGVRTGIIGSRNRVPGRGLRHPVGAGPRTAIGARAEATLDRAAAGPATAAGCDAA